MKQRNSHTVCVFDYAALEAAGFDVINNGTALEIKASHNARPILSETTMNAIGQDAQEAQVPEDKFLEAVEAMQQALQMGLILNIAMGE